MPWVWTDELLQRLETEERRSWVPLIAYRVGTKDDLDRLARNIVAETALVEKPPEDTLA